jgi:hypothetical protein
MNHAQSFNLNLRKENRYEKKKIAKIVGLSGCNLNTGIDAAVGGLGKYNPGAGGGQSP